MARFVSDVLDLMRTISGRRNENDPDSSDALFLRYLNDAINLTMSNDVRLYENFGTLTFTIDETNPTGVYTFNDVGAADDFMNLSAEAFISLLDPIGGSISWNRLPIYQDPGEFFSIWGINNEDILIRGYPTAMLYYGTEFVFRTIPNVPYMVKIYGYKKVREFPDADEPLRFDEWLRYLAYLAMYNYARDYRYDAETLDRIQQGYARERKLLLTNTHNQIKVARAFPRF